MRSKARRGFWNCFDSLPQDVQGTARAKFRLWRREPFHPSLHFKVIRGDVWSVRINDNYRALGLRDADLMVWFWIGTHSDYDRLIKG